MDWRAVSIGYVHVQYQPEPAIQLQLPRNQPFRVDRTPGIWLYFESSGSSHGELVFSKNDLASGSFASSNRSFTDPGLIYVGQYTFVEGTTQADENIRILVPVDANSGELNGTEARDLLLGAAERLPVGKTKRPSQLYLIRPRIDPGSESFVIEEWLMQTGGTGEKFTYLREAAAPGAWIHEYVHRRQRFETTHETKWLTEGMATYVGQYLLYELGYWSREEFRQRLNKPHRTNTDVLSNQGTWHRITPYAKGSTVIGYIDQRVREGTDGQKTIIDVFRRLNKHDTVTHESFKDAVAAVVGDDRLDEEIDRYVLTDAHPANHEYIYVVGEDPGITVTPTPTPTVRPPPTYNESQTPTPPDTPTSPSTTGTGGGASTGSTPGFGIVVATIAAVVAVLTSRE